MGGCFYRLQLLLISRHLSSSLTRTHTHTHTRAHTHTGLPQEEERSIRTTNSSRDQTTHNPTTQGKIQSSQTNSEHPVFSRPQHSAYPSSSRCCVDQNTIWWPEQPYLTLWWLEKPCNTLWWLGRPCNTLCCLEKHHNTL